jgi:hypothetical protein
MFVVLCGFSISRVATTSFSCCLRTLCKLFANFSSVIAEPHQNFIGSYRRLNGRVMDALRIQNKFAHLRIT